MRRKSPVDLANSIITMLREEIAREREKASGCPFTQEELEEAAADLDEEAFDYHSADWIAYCTTCKAAVGVDNDHRVVLAAARTHARKHPEHQVIVGWEALGRTYGVCAEP